MPFKELRQQSGMNIKQFSEYFNIPYKTVQKWNSGERSCHDYLIDLMHYKLKNEGKV
jgi:DNA-binding transcriptional regulator YiaG